MGPCKTVRVISTAHAEYGGFVEINESDFDPEIHAIFNESDPKPAKSTQVVMPSKAPEKRAYHRKQKE